MTSALLLWRQSKIAVGRRAGGSTMSFSQSITTRNHLRQRPPSQGCLRFFSGNSDNTDPGGDTDPSLTEWIPPSRPLVGDKGYSHLYRRDAVDNGVEEESEEEELARIERELKALEAEKDSTIEGNLQQIEDEWMPPDDKQAEESNSARRSQSLNMDWLQTRREKLGDEESNTGLTPSYDRPGQDLPVVHHTLFTADEIMTYLASLGGMNPNLVTDKACNEHGDTRMGGAFRGIIFVSGNSSAHVRMLSNSLVQQLKRRKLQELGVIGARHGAEGSDDADETWMCIDCHNYIVNIQDEATRRMLDLEGWWSQGDPLAGYDLDNGIDDEDAMDEFVSRNPVPPDYGRSGMVDWNCSINQLEQKRWTAPHKTERRRTRMGRKGGKKKKRRR